MVSWLHYDVKLDAAFCMTADHLATGENEYRMRNHNNQS